MYENLLILKCSWPCGFCWYCLSMAALSKEQIYTKHAREIKRILTFKWGYIKTCQYSVLLFLNFSSNKPYLHVHETLSIFPHLPWTPICNLQWTGRRKMWRKCWGTKTKCDHMETLKMSLWSVLELPPACVETEFWSPAYISPHARGAVGLSHGCQIITSDHIRDRFLIFLKKDLFV